MNVNKSTNRETVKNLSKSILTRLENQKAILFDAGSRDQLREEVYNLIGPSILTEEDLHHQTLEKIGSSVEESERDEELLDSAPYRTAKSMVRKTFGDDQLNGFYFQKSLKSIATDLCKYFMEANSVEDVFESDEKLAQMIVDVIRKFNPASLH